jgi:tetratricopeptide (TPR) repeat protein
MVIDLHSRWQRACFLAAVVLVAGVLAFFSGKFFLAAQFNASSKPDSWRLAARLEPGNARYWRRLGLSRQWDVGAGDVQNAVGYLQLASRVDPHSADVWMELADAYQTSGDSIQAQRAYENAKANYPISSEVAWRYGNFLLYEGKQPEGYTEIRRALLVDPSIATTAIDQCWRSDPQIAPILERVLPAKAEYYRTAMNYFLGQNQVGPALAVWNHQHAIGVPIQMSDSIPLVDSLIAEDRIAEAQQVWRQAVEAPRWRGNSVKEGSLVWNGGFERGFANGGFDWREVDANGSSFDFDSFGPHSGSRSLRVSFDGTANLDFHNLFQEVPAESGTRYHFSAYLRTEGITTDRGVGFEIYDPRHPSQVQVVTSEMIGTNPWTEVQADVQTGTDTHLLRIVLRRTPSWKFDNKLSGTVWVDDVTLTSVSAAIQDGSK